MALREFDARRDCADRQVNCGEPMNVIEPPTPRLIAMLSWRNTGLLYRYQSPLE
jgi:hypothetical protein